MEGRRKARAFAERIALIAAALLAWPAHEARAMDRDVRAVLITGAYGAGVGTVLGLASYPVAGEVRGIFMGTSIGLYLGIALGVYFVIGKDDPGNPYRSRALLEGGPVFEGAAPRAGGGPVVRFDYPVVRF